jgi:hypothetical protein
MLPLHIVIIMYRVSLWPYVYPLSLCTVIATGKIGNVITFGTSEQLSLLLVTSLGILESLSLLEVTLRDSAKGDNV